uniref:Uncharacterized protein n=1 Tax=Anguilla anguilla TaxID=7936 RepID=A0A0E9W8X1_ANGAN
MNAMTIVTGKRVAQHGFYCHGALATLPFVLTMQAKLAVLTAKITCWLESLLHCLAHTLSWLSR